MAFVDDFIRIWRDGGREAAFVHVEKLFTDPAHQKRQGKPSDFLHDDDDDEDDDSPAAERRRARRAKEQLSPADGFRELVEGFQPKRKAAALARWILDRLEESRVEEPQYDAAHPFQPWNQLDFQLGHYEHLDVQVRSMHVAGARRVSQYGLYHEIIGGADTCEEYKFTYDLTFSKEVVLRYGDEVVAGKIAHAAAKAAIYAPYLREVIDALVADERFARIPKALPFAFRFRSHEYAELAFDVELAPSLDSTALASHPLREVYLAAAVVPEVTRDQRFLYHLARARADEASLTELVEMVRAAPDLVAVIRTVGEDSLLRTRALDAHGRDNDVLAAAVKGDARLEEIFDFAPAADPSALLAEVRKHGPPLLLVIDVLRAIGDATARSLARARFELPAPAWAAHDGDEVELAERHMKALRELLAKAPADEQAELARLYDAALDRLASSGHPIVSLSILEARVPAEQAKVFEKEDESDEADANDDGVDGAGDDDSDDDEPKAAVGGPATTSDLAPPPDRDAFAALPPAGKVLVRAGSQPYIDAVIASIAVRKYGRLTDETMTRLKALGPLAIAAEPALRAYLVELCSDGYNHDAEVTPIAEALWRIGAEDVPEQVHAAHRSNEFYMEAFYPKWAKAAPARRLQRLLAALRAEPASAASPSIWETGLYDSAPAFAMYREAIAAAPERDAWIAGLVRAVAGANDLVFRFVRDWGREASRKDQAIAATMLEPIEARLSDEVVAVKYGYNQDSRSDTARLRRARMHRLAGLLEVDTPEADAERARLAACYPGDATIGFLETMRVVHGDGPRAAGERTLAHARRLSADDIVYAKAVFQYTRTASERWEAIDIAHAFALHDIAERAFRKGAWTDGKLDKNPSELDEDPLFEGMYDVISQMSDAEVDDTLAGYRRALATLEGSSADLVAALDANNWELSWLVAKKLARDATPAHVARLVELFGWFAGDETRRRQLGELIWPLPGARDALLADATFREHLADFIWRYPRRSDELAREILGHFAARGEDEHIVAVAEHLESHLVIAVALSILNAYVRLRRFDDAVALLEKTRKEVKAKQPEWVLLAANIAALQAQGGKHDAAEATLADLFARDWSRFEYTKSEDNAMIAIIGGDLDAQYAAAFRRYWAMAKFNAACLHALRGRSAEAITALRQAVRYAPDAYPAPKLRAERDLVLLADDPDFQQLLAELPEGGAA